MKPNEDEKLQLIKSIAELYLEMQMLKEQAAKDCASLAVSRECDRVFSHAKVGTRREMKVFVAEV